MKLFLTDLLEVITAENVAHIPNIRNRVVFKRRHFRSTSVKKNTKKRWRRPTCSSQVTACPKATRYDRKLMREEQMIY